MYLDLDIVRKKLEVIEDEINFLKEIQKLNINEFQRDLRNLKSTCRSLQNAIQALIDLGNHIISSLNLGKPEIYEDIPSLLFENKVITKSFKEKFIYMIKFRNFLVHEYDRVNPLRIYKILKENIDDIESGMKLIKNFIDKNLK
ncbi:MAG TPA: DUF86 domain-containing protein [Caldisericia bacterium]|nr:DUF86 domain-containing protein [Caldisericia bacterium]